MRRPWLHFCLFFLGSLLVLTPTFAQSHYTLVGWNNLGMHCMDSDYSVLSLLPPFNTIQAQLIDPNGRLVKSPTGITVTYQAVADPTNSINKSSITKTNFWQFVQALFGGSPAPDVGLTGNAMPGTANTPRPMKFDAAMNWFIADGIPLTPIDDAGKKNTYPMMRLTARNSSGTVLATTDIVLPVSDEMDCKTCHLSGSNPAAMPKDGWVFNADPTKDIKLNILRRKDGRHLDPSDPFNAKYKALLQSAGYNPGGLYLTALGGKPILCVNCHTSNALPGFGDPSIHPLTQDMHTLHSKVVDPTNGMALGDIVNRSACYRCHPGAVTKCLRGVMGNAVAADGTMEIQCQNCHGAMAVVGTAGRKGWLEEPTCQGCHTGTATSNNGQIRFTTVFEPTGQPRQAINPTFATNQNTPDVGLSMYRFSSGHGGLQCSACHGSTHAEFPTSHPNDNIENTKLQGHVGMLAECSACHTSTTTTSGGTTTGGSDKAARRTAESTSLSSFAATINSATGGPHGMHTVGQQWVSAHPNAVENSGRTQCQACHGIDYRGTVLSRSKADRTLSTEFGQKVFWRGFQIGCYACHNGPSSEDASRNRPAVVSNTSATTTVGNSVAITLTATDPNGNPLTLRIVSQPINGTVALSGKIATFFPDPGFVGTDSFTFSAWDGFVDSNLGTVTLTVK
jgi:Big-like domain-containing protein